MSPDVQRSPVYEDGYESDDITSCMVANELDTNMAKLLASRLASLKLLPDGLLLDV